jgi:TRAP-type C4-dicarboxylate transport system permease small subunit
MNKLLTKLDQLEKIVGIIAISIMSVLVMVDVISREVFHQSVTWAQKLAVYLMIWSGFIGPSLVARKGNYLRPQLAEKFWFNFNPNLYARLHSLACLSFHLMLAYFAFGYIADSFEFNDQNIVLKVPMWLLQVIIPYSFLSLSLKNLYYVLHPDELVQKFQQVEFS